MKSIQCEFVQQLLNSIFLVLSISPTHIWGLWCWLSLDRVSVSLLFMANWFVVRFWHKMAAMNHPGRPTGCWRMKCLHSCLTSAFTFSDASPCEDHLYGSNHNAISFRIMSVVSTTSHRSSKDKVLRHAITYWPSLWNVTMCHLVGGFTFRGAGSLYWNRSFHNF